jgi:glycosyltransferase involved in cell wall biosynthesis
MTAKPAANLTVDVVIPVLNEAHVLAKSVATVRAFLQQNLPHRWRVVVVDNGSTDGTDKVAEKLASAHSDVGFFHLDQRGRGRALRHAWTQSNADIVGYMDVDLSTELAAVPRAVKALYEEGYDIAIGSRLLRESQTRRKWKRDVISRIYNVLVKGALFTRFSDAQCGFKFVTREVVERIVPQVQDESWFFDTEMLVLAEKQGYRIKDLPVIWIEDDDSRVKIIRTAWDDIKGVARLRGHLWSAGFAEARRAHGKKAAVPSAQG